MGINDGCGEEETRKDGIGTLLFTLNRSVLGIGIWGVSNLSWQFGLFVLRVKKLFRLSEKKNDSPKKSMG